MKLLIATPLEGSPETARVTWGYHQAVRSFERGGATILSEGAFAGDVVRARSRMAHHALLIPDWTHLLWWDEDVVPSDVGIVQRMIASGHRMIGAPYPRKQDRVAFPYTPTIEALRSGEMVGVNDCVQVQMLAFGFMLTHRDVLEDMSDAYSDDWFSHLEPRGMTRIVELFGLRHRNSGSGADEIRDLLSEDNSFCDRWTSMGGEVWMYAGPGAPVGHVGGKLFIGTRDELGQVR